jgi:hypothetical protein
LEVAFINCVVAVHAVMVIVLSRGISSSISLDHV